MGATASVNHSVNLLVNLISKQLVLLSMQETVSVKVPKDLKKKMKKLPIKWSEVIRKTIEREISIYERRKVVKDLLGLASSAPKVPKGTSTKIIKEIREEI